MFNITVPLDLCPVSPKLAYLGRSLPCLFFHVSPYIRWIAKRKRWNYDTLLPPNHKRGEQSSNYCIPEIPTT